MKNQGKIIHVMLDEKFNDMAIRQFEEVEAGIHEYWIVATELRLTKSSLARTCEHVTLAAQLSRLDVKAIIFHSLPPQHYPLLRNIPDGKCVVWIGWGYDYYSLLKHEDEMSRIMPRTRSLNKKPIAHQFKGLLRYILRRLRSPSIYSVKALARVNYFSPVLDIEFGMVKKYVALDADYIEWNYGTVEDDFSIANAGFVEGNNILVGNSATATNNHIELFQQIASQVNLNGKKVIAPLSYGDPYYRDRVIRAGEKFFGQAFVPLTEYMPLEQYLMTIRSCEFVIMNHLRQQALANICMAILMGAKLYLNEGNPLFDWFSRRGVVFGSIEHLDMLPLTEVDRVNNSHFIHSHWGRAIQAQKTRRLVNLVLVKSTSF